MSDDTTRRQFLLAAGSGTAAMLAGCGGNAPSEEETPEPTDTPTEADDGGMGEDTATPEPTDTRTEEPTDTPTPTPSEEELREGGTLQLASPGPIQTLDPVNAKGSGAGYNQYQQSLMAFPNGDLPPVGELATDYSVSEDGRTYTFTLREDVQFHDGQELTGADFVYSWERLAGAEETRNADDIVGGTFTIAHEGNTGDSVTNYVPGSLAVEAPSDYEFRFTLAEPFHGAISQIAGGAFGVIPEGAVAYPKDYEDHGLDGLMWEGEYEYNEYFSTAGDGPYFAGTGPFQVDSWSKGDQLTLSGFEDYWGEGPYLDEIVYTVISSASTRYQRFLNGNLDILEGFPTAQFTPDNRTIERDRGSFRAGTYTLDNGRTVNYGEATALDTDYILFNCSRTPKPVRQAFAYMINQHEIARQVYKGLPDPAYNLTPPPVFMAREGETPAENYDRHAREGFRAELDLAADGWPYGYDETRLDDARRVMEEAGYSADDPYQVEFTVFSGNSAWDRIAKRLRDKAQTAHIEVDITKADFGTIISQAINGQMDMFSLGDGMEWPESDNFLRFLHPYEDPSFMFTRWTYNVAATGVDFEGDDPETAAENVHANLGGDVARDHVSANAEDGTVTVVIDGVTADDLAGAVTGAGYGFDEVAEHGAEWSELMPVADDAWDELYLPNRAAGSENQRKRNRAYYILEEVNWESVQELPTTHTVTQRLWNPEVNVRMAGTMENQTFNTVTIDREE